MPVLGDFGVLWYSIIVCKARNLEFSRSFTIGNGGNYRAGQVIPHDALLNYQCPGEAERDPQKPPLQCKLGRLIPANPHCGVLGHGANKDWLGNLHISASSHIVKNGNMDLEKAELDIDSDAERLSKTHVISEIVIEAEEEDEAPCAKPEQVTGTLVYKGNTQVSFG